MTMGISQQDWELLSAYLDGELDETSTKALEARLLVEGDLADIFNRMAAQHIVLHRQASRIAPPISDAFAARISATLHPQRSPVPAGHMPARSRADIARPNAPVFAVKRVANDTRPDQHGTKFHPALGGMAVAASVVLAFIGGWAGGKQGPALMSGGKQDAGLAQTVSLADRSVQLDSLIDQTLDTTDSGKVREASLNLIDGKTTARIEPLSSFKQAGLVCRDYRAQLPGKSQTPTIFFGRACRDPQKGWQNVYRLFPGKGAKVDLPDRAELQKL